MGSSKQIQEQINEIIKGLKHLKIMCNGNILMNDTTEITLLNNLKELESNFNENIKELKNKFK